MALSFTPDGYLVAAASYDRILIWRAEEGALPKACWVGEAGRWAGGSSSKVNEEEEGEKGEDHSLSWDADGGKLAFGLGRQVRDDLNLFLDWVFTGCCYQRLHFYLLVRFLLFVIWLQTNGLTTMVLDRNHQLPPITPTPTQPHPGSGHPRRLLQRLQQDLDPVSIASHLVLATVPPCSHLRLRLRLTIRFEGFTQARWIGDMQSRNLFSRLRFSYVFFV